MTECRRRRGGFPLDRAGASLRPKRLVVTEEGEHGEDAAVVVLALGEAELLEDPLHVTLDRARAEVEPLPDRPVRPALGDLHEHVALAVVELVDDRAATAAYYEALD